VANLQHLTSKIRPFQSQPTQPKIWNPTLEILPPKDCKPRIYVMISTCAGNISLLGFIYHSIVPKLILFLLFPLLLTPMWAVQQSGSVRSGGLAIPGATVTATQGEQKVVTTTDDAGQYTFNNLAAGAWTLQVEIFGFTPARREVTVDDKPSNIDWTLDLKSISAPAPVSNGAPVSNAAPGSAAPVSTAETTPAPASTAKPSGPQPSRARSGRPTQGTAGGRQNSGGFQNLSLNDTAEGQAMAAADGSRSADTGAPEAAGNANEAFLVNGTLSSGLDAPGQQGPFDRFHSDDPNRMFGGGDRGPGGSSGMPSIFGGDTSSSSRSGRGGPGGGGPGGGDRGGFGGGDRGSRGPGGDRGRTSRGPTSSSFGNRRGGGRGGMHGYMYMSEGNSAVDARPYSLTGQTVDKASFAQTRFGASVGGGLNIPKIIHSSKTFLFLNYTGTRQKNPFSAVETLPTALERSGDFSQSSVRGLPVNIFDPTTGAPFPNNLVPASRINPAANGLLSFIPLPNQPGALQNFQFISSIPQNTDNLSTRVSQTLTKKDRISVSFNLQTRNQKNSQNFGFQDKTTGLGLSDSLGWTHNLTAHAVNSLTWTFSRNRNQITPFFAYTSDVDAQLGIKGTSTAPINYGPPNLSFTNYGALTDASPVTSRSQTSSLGEGVALTAGKHNVSVGGDFRRIQINNLTDSNARGTFSFSGLSTSAISANGQPLPNTGYDFTDFLLGFPQSSSVRFGSANTYFRGSVYDAYGMDDWRLLSNLTIILGLRYEYFTPYTEKYNNIANLDIAPNLTGVAVVTPGQSGPYSGSFPDALINPEKNAFSPRVGLAWRPTPKGHLMVRAGYGMFYNGSAYNQFPGRLASQPPFASTTTLTNSLADPLTLQNGFPTLISTTPGTIVTNSYAIDRNYRMPYAQTWNFNISREFPHSIIVDLGYLGTKGTRLDLQSIPNQAPPGSPLTAEQRRPDPNAVGFTFEQSNGDSIYHAAQVRVTRRFQKGIGVYALYTFAKSIDDASTIGGGGTTVAQNPYDFSAERGLSSFDRRHTLTLSYEIASPVGKNTPIPANGLAGKLLSDWTLSGSITAQSGLPFTARVQGNQANAGGTGSVGSGRAEATGAPLSGGQGQFFNLGAFTVPVPGTLGDAGRNTIQGPGLFSLNLSLARSFTLLGNERHRIEARVDATNFTNHPGVTSIGTVVNAANFGIPLAMQGMRTLSATVRLRF
jgi:hypothetical protein